MGAAWTMRMPAPRARATRAVPSRFMSASFEELGESGYWAYGKVGKVLKQVKTCFTLKMGMETPSGARLDILELLLREELSSQQLSDRLGVSPAAVRQHLTTLEALGLVVRRKVVTQPGRPTYLYRVSPKGMRIFPKRYDTLLGQMIDVLSERQGAEAVEETIAAAAKR